MNELTNKADGKGLQKEHNEIVQRSNCKGNTGKQPITGQIGGNLKGVSF